MLLSNGNCYVVLFDFMAPPIRIRSVNESWFVSVVLRFWKRFTIIVWDSWCGQKCAGFVDLKCYFVLSKYWWWWSCCELPPGNNEVPPAGVSPAALHAFMHCTVNNNPQSGSQLKWPTSDPRWWPTARGTKREHESDPQAWVTFLCQWIAICCNTCIIISYNVWWGAPGASRIFLNGP